MKVKNYGLFLIPALLLAGCETGLKVSRSASDPEFMKPFNSSLVEYPDGMVFLPQKVPNLAVPPDIGNAETGDFPRELVEKAFNEAYVEALFRGLPLTGVLGGDRVHPWPPNAPVGIVQNWNSALKKPNSWGIPGLVLALSPADQSGYVFVLSGAVLDQYGRSAGLGGANGAVGYGLPLGDVFFENGAAVQVFTRGTIRIAGTGSSFFPGTDHWTQQEAEDGDWMGDKLSPEIAAAFLRAWNSAPQLRERLSADGAVMRLSFSKPWTIEGEGENFSLDGLYLVTFDEGRFVLVLADAAGFPLRARFIGAPFLNALLRSGERLEGAEDLSPSESLPVSPNPYVKALLDGFSLYGIPLSDSLPQALEAPQESEAPFREAQRFSRGWMIAAPVLQ
jgi:hypothetical protein